MIITARSPHGHAPGRGVIGHAAALTCLWEVQPPLTAPAGFGQPRCRRAS